MSFPRYPKYKDSGVEWLGEVPGHWEVKRLKQTCHVYPSNVDKKSYDGETPVQLCNYTDVYYNDTILASTDFMVATATEDQIAKFTLQAGDTIITKDSETADDIAIAAYVPADLPGVVCGYHLSMIRPTKDANGAFVKRLFDSTYVKSCVAVRANGLTRVGLGQYEIDNLDLPFPPLPEQTQIAAFLDRETAKIDALVAEQRRLMVLLKEKRQAVISHAVTRGLNPDVPMKPSGIEWLGDVPEHWEVLPIKRIVSVPITDGPHETPSFIDEGVPFVSAEAVSSGCINFLKVRACISEEDNARYSLKYAPKLHDIYMVKSGATTGITAIVEDRTDFNIWSPLAAIRCNEDSVPHFVLNFMRSKHFQEAVTLNWSFGTQQNIGMGVIENLACTVPPVAEQREIAQTLKNEIAKFETLTTEAQRAIDLLRERRTALISAAVTGQIDVRGA
ncbi:MAG: restriction endonuclease subunit S [Rhodoferax sp.]|uniref:restriction endonuclease subunit S n=1 Tax=Rhodoferax sp. TaxID=50421 RepID=UPI002639638A|nr:restriction endonuclease subunit S [Rhodoferax sp.]MDD2882938.1 restriction endonuclease subunit S [Rhodoferax sp.]